MELDTELHHTLGCRLSLHKSSLREAATLGKAVDFLHRHQELTTASLFDLI